MLVEILVLAVVLGLVYYCLTLLPIPDPFRTIILVVMVLIILLYLVGLLPGGGRLLHR